MLNEKEFYSAIRRRKEWDFAEVTRADTMEATHGYHKYPAKFIPQLVSAILNQYSVVGAKVWDPFCGSGTLNLEAFRQFRPSLGTDINPTAVLLSRVKSTVYNPSTLKDFVDVLLEAIDRRPLCKEATYTQYGVLNGNLPILKHWYSDESLLRLAHILYQIRRSKPARGHQQFALCAFSAILKRSSYWLNSSVKAQVDPSKTPDDPRTYFRRQITADDS